MTTSTTLRRDRRASRVPARWRAWAAAVVVVGGALVAAALPAAAEDGGQDAVTSSVQISPEPATGGGQGGVGSASCAALAGSVAAARAWQAIRFAPLPEVGASATASVAGVSATVTRLSAGTAAFVATTGIDLVFVGGAGQPGTGATFRYDPPARGASGVSGREPADPIGSVLLCFATPAAPATQATAARATEAAPVTRTAVVRAHAVSRAAMRPAQARPAATPTAVAASPTPALPRLPETGVGTLTLVLAGLSLLGLGSVAALAGRGRRIVPDS